MKVLIVNHLSGLPSELSVFNQFMPIWYINLWWVGC